jgi:hypothetical protein
MSKQDNLSDFIVDLKETIRIRHGYNESVKINPQDFSNEINKIVGDIDENEDYRKLINRNITYVNIPKGLTTNIGDSAFRACRSLYSVVIPEGVTNISGSAFAYCSALTSIKLPSTLTRIGGDAFQWCTALKNITVPNNVSEIAAGAFRACSSLQSFKASSELKIIGSNALQNCSSLKSFTASSKLTTIGSNAFENCSQCTEFNFKTCTQVPELGSNAFYNINPNAKILVPVALYNEWKNATNWVKYRNNITYEIELPEVPV